jgi:hypothetical protein
MTTATIHPASGPPLTATDMERTVYRVPLHWLGEDAEQVMGLGHVKADRFVAAAHRYLKWAGCDGLDEHYASAAQALEAVTHRWVIRLPKCLPECGPDCEDAAAGKSMPLDSDYAWYLDWDGVTESTPGAFPITLLDLP